MRGGGVKECAEGLEMAHMVNSKKLKVVGVQGSGKNRQEMKLERTAVLQHGVALHTLLWSLTLYWGEQRALGY